ncbi:MAG TPA: alpha/beta fold hydrolase [Rhodothermales bacterium]|nr:alpha/beta fold hydrolase [Rhodothermales bacterium]
MPVLHDWNGDGSGYRPMLPFLDPERFTYVFADLRGYGRSRHPAGAHTLAEVSWDCLRLAGALGWDGFSVVGHSMTGMVTQRLATDAPDRIAAAVALCPLSAAGSPADAAGLAFLARTVAEDDALRGLLRHVGRLPEDWLEEGLRRCRASADPGTRAAYLRMFAGASFAEEVKGLATPFLVVVGDRDPGLDADAMRRAFLA